MITKYLSAKILLAFIGYSLILNLSTIQAQVVKDPLLDYYRQITSPGFVPQNSTTNFRYTAQTEVYLFEAYFTGSKQKALFITDEGELIDEAHQNYMWSVYYPVKSGGYRLANGEVMLWGPDGPPYVGYIDQIKGYGAISFDSRHEIDAYYIENGAVKIKGIHLETGYAIPDDYLKYLKKPRNNYHVVTYTLTQLAKKFAKLPPNNTTAPK